MASEDYLMGMDPLNAWQEPVEGAGGLPLAEDPKAKFIERLMWDQMQNRMYQQPRDQMQILPNHPMYNDYPMPEGGFGDDLPADPNLAQEYQNREMIDKQRSEPDPALIQDLYKRLQGGEQASLGQKYRNYPFNDRFGNWPEDERQEGIRRLIDEFNQVKRARV